MKASSQSMTNIALVLLALLSSTVAVLQYVSNQEPDLSATVHGHRHHHLFDFQMLPSDEQDMIMKKSHFPKQATQIPFVDGVYEIVLKNKGDTVAREVSVVVDGGVGFNISRANTSKIIDGNTVLLGGIRPTEELKIVAWTTENAHFSHLTEPGIAITYDNGVVELDLRYEIEGALRFIHKYDLHIMFVATMWLARISHQGDTELKFQAPMESNTVRTV